MKYKVVGYDSFDHEEFEIGKYETKEQAKKVAAYRAGSMILTYVYDDLGVQIAKYGSY